MSDPKMSNGTPTQEHVVHNSDGPDLIFEGQVLLDQTGQETGRVVVYRTAGGSYVFHQTRSGTGGVQALDRVRVFAKLEDARDWLGHTRGAKSVLEQLGLQARTRIV